MHYLPHKGSNYQCGYHNGLKLLICAESHYGDDDRTATQYHVGQHAAHGGYKTYTAIERIISGKILDENERVNFWNRTAFTNLVQSSLSERDELPDDRLWRGARRAAAKILSSLEPDVTFVFTRRGWRNLRDCGELHGMYGVQALRSPHREPEEALVYELGSGRRVLMGCFNHPTNPVLPHLTWHEWAMCLLARAPALIH